MWLEARQRCESGFYHMVLREINRRDIFFADDDSVRSLETLVQKKRNQQYEIYGHCLISNHIHLLVRENMDTISRTMSRIGTSSGKLQGLGKDKRGAILRAIKESDGVTIRQIARVTGLNVMNVQRA